MWSNTHTAVCRYTAGQSHKSERERVQWTSGLFGFCYYTHPQCQPINHTGDIPYKNQFNLENNQLLYGTITPVCLMMPCKIYHEYFPIFKALKLHPCWNLCCLISALLSHHNFINTGDIYVDFYRAESDEFNSHCKHHNLKSKPQLCSNRCHLTLLVPVCLMGFLIIHQRKRSSLISPCDWRSSH